MLLLILSLLPFVAGPLLVRGLQKSPASARALDSFVLVALGGLIFIHILPHAVEEGGGWALGAAAAGLLIPFLGEHFVYHKHRFTITPVLVLGLLGLGLHGVLDGVAIASSHTHAEGGDLLAMAVLMHRLPAGLAVWWLVRPRMGARAALIIVSIIITATIGGFYLGIQENSELFHGSSWFIIQALLSGSLIHVLLHQSTAPAAAKGMGWHPGSLIGGLVAVALLYGMTLLESHGGEHDHGGGFGQVFMALSLKTAFPLLIAYVLAALLRTFDTRGLNRWLGKGSSLSQALRGTVAGMPLNICSCAVTSLYQGLVTRGVPTTAALAFLVAAPEIGIGAIILSLELLGYQVGLMRVLFASGLGLVIGIGLGKVAARSKTYKIMDDAEEDAELKQPLLVRAKAGIAFGFGVVANRTLPWLLVGMGLAAFLKPILDPQLVSAVPWFLQVPLMALIGAPLYVCATGSTPLVAMLIGQGISPGAGIAFLLTGPATNVTTMGVLSKLHGKRLSLLFSGSVLLGAVVFGYIIDFSTPAGYTAAVIDMDHAHGSPLEWVSLGLVGLLMLVSVARLGVPGFMAVVFPMHESGPSECGSSCDCGAPAAKAVKQQSSYECSDDNGHDHDHDHDPKGPGSCCSGH
jgi:uncharacterized protein